MACKCAKDAPLTIQNDRMVGWCVLGGFTQKTNKISSICGEKLDGQKAFIYAKLASFTDKIGLKNVIQVSFTQQNGQDMRHLREKLGCLKACKCAKRCAVSGARNRMVGRVLQEKVYEYKQAGNNSYRARVFYQHKA